MAQCDYSRRLGIVRLEGPQKMGVIREEVTGRTCVLEAHHLIGRSRRCSLQLAEPSVSGEHASIRWTGQSWVIKDLGSRYGTFVNAQPLQPGVPTGIQKGARLAFGREKNAWVVTEENSPEVMVVPADGGLATFSHGGLIAVPSTDQPTAVAFQDVDGRWVLEMAGRVDVIQEHVPFVVEGRPWFLCNASSLQSTSMEGDSHESMALDEALLRFQVSRDEEHVEITATWRDRPIELGARSHHYVLLTLARLRLRDIEKGEQASSAGWVDQDEFLKLLHLGAEKLNLDIFRARRQFGAAGFVPAAGIVQRRPGARQLRIGVFEISIDTV